MSSNVINQNPYLRTSRNFPFEIQPLVVEVNRSYLDVANAVNFRTIGIFPSTVSALTGESWFVGGFQPGQPVQRQQTFRQVYPFGAIATGTELDIDHNLNVNEIVSFTRIYGTVITNIPDYRPLPYVDPGALNVSMTILVNNTQIRIVLGAGAPPVTSGYAVLEWLSNT